MSKRPNRAERQKLRLLRWFIASEIADELPQVRVAIHPGETCVVPSMPVRHRDIRNVYATQPQRTRIHAFRNATVQHRQMAQRS